MGEQKKCQIKLAQSTSVILVEMAAFVCSCGHDMICLTLLVYMHATKLPHKHAQGGQTDVNTIFITQKHRSRFG